MGSRSHVHSRKLMRGARAWESESNNGLSRGMQRIIRITPKNGMTGALVRAGVLTRHC